MCMQWYYIRTKAEIQNSTEDFYVLAHVSEFLNILPFKMQALGSQE